MSKLSVVSFMLALAVGDGASAFDQAQYERGAAAIRSLTGCYLIDYSYTETESMKDGYVRDSRVYDVNKDKSVKEFIYAEELSANHIRLQHILFAADLDGKYMEGSELRHQAEDWEFNASYLYDFSKLSTWNVKELSPNLWTRKITNLDDGLRYQCASTWNESTAFPEWTCNNYAPIPGRETRDMGRKDYNTLDRTTRIIAYGSNWLERQNNVKTIETAGVRAPLAKEVGKNWYVRLPDSDCAPVQGFVQERKAFWTLLRQTWGEVLTGDSTFVEMEPAGQPKRYMQMMALEADYASKMSDPEVKATVREKILSLINTFRRP
ncbi:MAG: DUF6607 family protein [Bdellovibrionota bacterium]